LGRAFGFVLGAIRPFILSPERGAETSIYLASSPEVTGVSREVLLQQEAD